MVYQAIANNKKKAPHMKKLEIKVDEIKSICSKHRVDLDHFWSNLSRNINFQSISQHAGRVKRSGVKVSMLFQLSLLYPLMSVGSVRSFLSGSFARLFQNEKSTFYRFAQDCFFDWRKVFYALSRQLRKQDLKAGNDSDRPTALIVDDSTLRKSGRAIEGVSMVYDHVAHKSVTGFQLLGLSWFNGMYSHFIDFSLVAEKKLKRKSKKKGFFKKRDPKSAGKVRKKELKKDKLTLTCEMLQRAVKQGFVPDFVLCDTWFTCAQIINYVRGLNKGTVHFLGMIKNGKRKFDFDEQKLTLKQLREKGVEKRCTRFKSRYVIVDCHLKDVGEVRVVFSRFHGNKKWVALITTDKEMSYIKAVETYAIRWNIEVGFKEAKQLLGLGKCQASDFDSQIAHTTSVLMAHALMVNSKFHEQWRSTGELFSHVDSQFRQLLTVEKLLLWFEELMVSLAEQMGGSDVVTIGELLTSEPYEVFKRMLNQSLLLGDQNAILPPSSGGQLVTTRELANAS